MGKRKLRRRLNLFRKEAYKEGNVFEAKVYSSPEYTVSIILKIPKNVKKSEKLSKTIEAIKSKKYNFIFQAFFLEDRKIGIADILERIERNDGSIIYQIGEIKASKEITVAFIMQMIHFLVR